MKKLIVVLLTTLMMITIVGCTQPIDGDYGSPKEDTIESTDNK